MARAMDIADCIIVEAEKRGKPVSNLKLQKIMYFLNVIYLLEKHKDLITDNKFEKWSYGPVIRQVYSQYAKNGPQEIKEVTTYKYLVEKNNQYEVESYEFNYDQYDKGIKEFISEKIDPFLDFGPFELVEKTHLEPQWKNKETKYYDDQKTIRFYENKDKRFWEKS